jgi:diadenosine tetraphosphate (Ap4A) HIT family hydrolase
MGEYSPFDMESYVARVRTGPCFICSIVAGKDDSHQVIYRDDVAIAFLNKYPTLYGYTLVAPIEHREQVTGDYTVEEYFALQRIVYRVAEAVRLELGAERVYILSLGSQQGNRHVHWHIAPLPPGVPFEEQQLEALMVTRKGYLHLAEDEMSALTRRLGERLARPTQDIG